LESLTFRGKTYESELMDLGTFEDIIDLENQMSELTKQRKDKHGGDRKKLTDAVDVLYAEKCALVIGQDGSKVVRSKLKRAEVDALENYFFALAADFMPQNTSGNSPALSQPGNPTEGPRGISGSST
jgi:hypothetical protein